MDIQRSPDRTRRAQPAASCKATATRSSRGGHLGVTHCGAWPALLEHGSSEVSVASVTTSNRVDWKNPPVTFTSSGGWWGDVSWGRWLRPQDVEFSWPAPAAGTQRRRSSEPCNLHGHDALCGDARKSRSAGVRRRLFGWERISACALPCDVHGEMIVFCLPEPFFAFLSARFCLRLLAATFLVCLPPLSLFPIVTSRPTTRDGSHTELSHAVHCHGCFVKEKS